VGFVAGDRKRDDGDADDNGSVSPREEDDVDRVNITPRSLFALQTKSSLGGDAQAVGTKRQ
jgi:hypothetical protein